MGNDLTLIYAAVGAAIVFITVMIVVTTRRRARWEELLNHVAKTLKGRYAAGHRVSLAWIPGSVEAKIDGRSLSLGQETVNRGSSGNDRPAQRMVIQIGTSKSKPEFLGLASSPQSPTGEVTDYSSAGKDHELEIGGQRVPVVKMSKVLRKRLDESETARGSLAELLAAGGAIEHGNVVLRSFEFESDAERLLARIRNMSAIADLVD